MANAPEVNPKKPNSKGLVLQARFAKFYLSERIDGKPNPYFGKAVKAAIKAGYSESYADKIMAEIQKQNSGLSTTVANLRKSLETSLATAGVNGMKIADLVTRLMDKNDSVISVKTGKVFKSNDPDSHAARIALDFLAKTQDLYVGERHIIRDEFDGLSKEELIGSIIRRLTTGSKGNEGLGGKR